MSIKPLVLVMAGLLGLCLAPAGAAPEQPHGFLDLTCRSPDGNEGKYVLFVPYDYQGDKDYPLIVFLHGSGEAGTDGRRAASIGLATVIRQQVKTFPFLVVFPQAHRNDWRPGSEDTQRAMAIVDDVQKNYRVDPKRISVTGLSSGGDGTWSLAAQYPDRWAAIVPLCGEGDPKDAVKIKDIACWYFMGSNDNRHDVETAHATVKALKDAGANPKYTEYQGMGHRIWDKAYGTPELYPWLLEQHRK